MPVVGVVGIHVVHVVHATHLLLDRCGDGLFYGLRVRSGIRSLHLSLRGSDVRKLGGGQSQHCYNANEDHENGNHHGDDGTANEETGHGSLSLSRAIELLGMNHDPVLGFLHPFGNHLFSRVQALGNDPHLSHALARFHGTDPGFVICTDHYH